MVKLFTSNRPQNSFFSIYIRPNLFTQLLLNKVQEQALFVMHFEHTHTHTRARAHAHTQTRIQINYVNVTLGCSKTRLRSNLYKTTD